jgi:hypothetical protein
VSRLKTSSAGLLVLSVAAAVAGCGGPGATTAATTTTAPDRLTVDLRADDAATLRVELGCAVADRAACAAILSALAAARREEHCAPVTGSDDASLRVSGTIGGRSVRALLRRRTDCEIRSYDAVAAGLGL